MIVVVVVQMIGGAVIVQLYAYLAVTESNECPDSRGQNNIPMIDTGT